jgi:hypothetical protein
MIQKKYDSLTMTWEALGGKSHKAPIGTPTIHEAFQLTSSKTSRSSSMTRTRTASTWGPARRMFAKHIHDHALRSPARRRQSRNILPNEYINWRGARADSIEIGLSECVRARLTISASARVIQH